MPHEGDMTLDTSNSGFVPDLITAYESSDLSTAIATSSDPHTSLTLYDRPSNGDYTFEITGTDKGDFEIHIICELDSSTTAEPTTVETTIDDSNCGYSIDDGGWTLVRHTYNKWFQSTDGLRGTAVYGTDCGPVCDDEFSIAFDAVNETEFLFSSGDCDRWMITTYDQFVFQWGSNYEATILKSHISDVPYTALWYNRGNSEDPWISYQDHWDENRMTNMYGENSYGGNAAYTDSYMNVWMRDAVLPTTTDEPTGMIALDINLLSQHCVCTLHFWISSVVHDLHFLVSILLRRMS